MNRALLQVDKLEKHYHSLNSFWSRRQKTVAVDRVSFAIRGQETLGIVGESGCGKSTLARCILGLEKYTGGRVLLEGKDIGSLPASRLRGLRRQWQIVFQDPYAALNPYLTVEASIFEPLKNYGLSGTDGQEEQVRQLLKQVGLPADLCGRYPHECSGGQLQRVNIARALASKPKLLVLDEAVSNLDGIVKRKIVDLLACLQKDYSLSMIFISHDLGAVRYLADRVAVMLAGRIVELLPVEELEQAQHPYTQYLLSSLLSGDPARRRTGSAGIEVFVAEDGRDRPQIGCSLQYRCPQVRSKCRKEEPQLVIAARQHQVACHGVSKDIKKTGGCI